MSRRYCEQVMRIIIIICINIGKEERPSKCSLLGEKSLITGLWCAVSALTGVRLKIIRIEVLQVDNV